MLFPLFIFKELCFWVSGFFCVWVLATAFSFYLFLTLPDDIFINRFVFLKKTMAISQLRSKRKATGGRYKRILVKRLARLGRLPVFTSIGSRRVKSVRTIGGNKKSKILRAEKVNVYDAKAKKHIILDIKNVVENPANSQYVRRNIITKGTLVETEKGKARITSRPGQEVVLNAVLVE